MSNSCFVFRCPVCGDMIQYGCEQCPNCSAMIDWSGLPSTNETQSDRDLDDPYGFNNPDMDSGGYTEYDYEDNYEDYQDPYESGDYDDESNDNGGYDDGFDDFEYYDGYDEEEYDPRIHGVDRQVGSEIKRYQQFPQDSMQFPQGGFNCPCCGGFVVDGSRFCPHCGEALDKDDWILGSQFDIPVQNIEVELVKPRCPQCDCEIEFGCQICPNCGVPIEWENRSDNLITFDSVDMTTPKKIHIKDKYVVEYPSPTMKFDTFNHRLNNKGRHLKVKDKYPPPTIIFSSL